MSDTYLSNKNGGRISPATEERLIEILQQLQTSLSVTSTEFNYEKLTASAAGVVEVGAEQVCKAVLLVADSNNTGIVTINDVNGMPVGTSYLPIPIDNTKKIRLYFNTASDVAWILWRN